MVMKRDRGNWEQIKEWALKNDFNYVGVTSERKQSERVYMYGREDGHALMFTINSAVFLRMPRFSSSAGSTCPVQEYPWPTTAEKMQELFTTMEQELSATS